MTEKERSGAATDGDIRTGAGEDSTTRDGFAADGQREHIKVVLCGASKYDQKYYFNWTFDGLPENVKEEIPEVDKEKADRIHARGRRRDGDAGGGGRSAVR